MLFEPSMMKRLGRFAGMEAGFYSIAHDWGATAAAVATTAAAKNPLKALTEPFGSVCGNALDRCGQLVGFKEAK
jgi:hypothetical protein